MNKSSSERSHSSSSSQQSFASTQRYLFALKNRGSKYGIDRMRRFTEALGHPQRKFPSIHVAGTNGKGSVCAMLEALYRGNGYKTGLYTSPHLVHLGERVQVNREMLSDQAIIDMIQRLKPIAETISAGEPDEHPSFFEFMTAAAFLRFAEAEVDLALIETGLGGRLDATNVLDPELSIITSISLDHTELLGDAIDKIAREKGGIIKPGKPVLIGKLADEAEKAIRQIADEHGSKVFSIRERFAKPDELPETNLAGSFQRWNAGVALYASEILSKQFPISKHDGLQNIDWAGRWQRIETKDRTLILDATHNPEGAEMLEENLQKLIGEIGQKPVIVAGTLGKDRGRSLMEVAGRYANEIHLLAPAQDRALSTDNLAELIPQKFQGPVFKDTIERLFSAPYRCTVGSPGDTIVVTGSLYLIGEVLQHLQGIPDSDLQDKI